MKKIKLFKMLLIPTIGITAIGTIAAVSTSCSPVVIVTGVSLNKSSLALEVGKTEVLTATVHPENATDKSVTWSSSDSSVVTVDNNGKVTAVGSGSAKITVKTNDGGYKAYCDVTVTYTATSYICVTANADSSFELINEGGNNPNLQYSIDGASWSTYDTTINIDQNQTLYLKGNNPDGWSHSSTKYSHFIITGDVYLSGNVMGLVDNGTNTKFYIPCGYCFYDLFFESTGITSVSKNFLPARTLADGCYANMFISCTSLRTAPKLPVTELADSCYSGMFANCTSLTAAPALPATTIASYCYSSMFEDCTSLTAAPELPATTLANRCYFNMFSKCTSLISAPDLPATTIANYCYWNMFNGCTSLTTAPALPATNLANSCYAYMFEECTSLTTAPDLPAMELAEWCYSYMFQKCTHLASVRISYDGPTAQAPDGAFHSWVLNVAATGTFYYTGTDPIPITHFGFPSGWTVNRN